MEFAQQLLTAATEFIAIAGISGIVAHALYTQHQRFMTEFCPPVALCQSEVQPEVKPEESQNLDQACEEMSGLFNQADEIMSKPCYQEVKSEAIAEIGQLAKKLVTEAMPATDAALNAMKEEVKACKSRSKKALKLVSVGAAAVNYTAMTSEQLRRECALQGVSWRTGGDYGKPMKKAQMLAALR